MFLILVSACIFVDPKGGDSDSVPSGTDCTPVTYYADADADGYAPDDAAKIEGDSCSPPTGVVQVLGDCDDTNAAVSPAALEVCDGALDEDCDGLVDDGDDSVDPASQATFYADADADSYGDAAAPVGACLAPAGKVTDSTDCNDADPAVNPAATEVCGGADEDCDGLTDDQDDSVDPATFSTFYADTDGDTYGDLANTGASCAPLSGYGADSTDCNDTDAAINPAAVEICDPGDVDEDCDAMADDADVSVDPTTMTNWYQDADGDGYGDPLASVPACSQILGYVGDSTDCSDVNAAVNPSGSEVCNGLDDDCDTLLDDADPSVDITTLTTYYEDVDADGYGDAAVTTVSCSLPPGYALTGDDCDTADAAINPGATEVCDATDTDQNCDGLADDADPAVDPASQTTWYADPDGNGFGEPANTVVSCESQAGYVDVLASATDVLCGAGVWADAADEATIDGANLVFGSTDAFTVSMTANIDESVAGFLLVKGSNEWAIQTVPAGTPDISSLCMSRNGLEQICLEVNTGAFHNYTWVYNNGTIEVYEDAVLIGTESGTISAGTTDPLTVGNFAGSTDAFVGSIDDLAIWTGAATAADVLAYYDGTTLAADFPGNLGWWRFDEGSGTTVGDLSPMATSMTLSGVDWATTCR